MGLVALGLCAGLAGSAALGETILPIANATGGAVVALDGPRTLVQKLHDPATTETGALAALRSAKSPEEVLVDALDALAAAPDPAAAARARQQAIDVLEGNPLPATAFDGIPLLNWNSPAKVKTVAAGGSVTVTIIRTADQSLSDTFMLRFDDPSRPFTIKYRVAELGKNPGGVFTPTPLLTNGTGAHALVLPLALPDMTTGTQDINRFHPTPLNLFTRDGIQEITVNMPAPNTVSAILDPSTRPTEPSLSVLEPATAARVAAAQAALGTDKAGAIDRLADVAPEKQLWRDLRGLNPADLAAAHTLGAQDRQLIGVMLTRTALPTGVPMDATADAVVAFMNNEVYLSKRTATIPPGAGMKVSVVNLDKFAHRFAAADLHTARGAAAFEWGQFSWNAIGDVVVPASSTSVVSVTPAADSFGLWVGDLDSGDQASAILHVAAGPRVLPPAPQPVVAPPAPAAPPVVAPAAVTKGGGAVPFAGPGGRSAAGSSVRAHALSSPAAPPAARFSATGGSSLGELAHAPGAPIALADATPKGSVKLVESKPAAKVSGRTVVIAGQRVSYGGLYKLGGMVLFLAIAWGWWSWGGRLPVRPRGHVDEAGGGDDQ
jgi:hypothetical protein